MYEDPHFAGLLRKLRAGSGLTQEEVAGRAGLSARAVGDLERGIVRRPRRRTVELLVADLELGEMEARLLIDAAGQRTRSASAAEAPEQAALFDRRTPHQLPPGSRAFVARSAELTELARAVGVEGPRTPGDVDGAETGQVVTVVGTGGIGKTALAVAWAHSVLERFPDGQLFVDLRGFDPRSRPVSPHEALGGFLHALGVVARQLPESVADRAALFRTLVADKRLLVVLDNAVDSEQVRPLLPAGPACRTLVTSRNRLAGLVAVEGARPVRLGPLADEDACLLLAARLDGEPAEAGQDELRELVRHCGGLPLAVTVLAARLALEPDITASGLVERLADEKARLNELGTTEAAADVRAVISWSIRRLDAQAAAMFRSLGLHPASAVSSQAAASLAGIPVRRSRRALRALADANLLELTDDDRWQSHDLIRLYASELADAELDAAAVANARRRMLDHYLHTAARADRLMHPWRVAIALDPAAPGTAVPVFVDTAAAEAWMDREFSTVARAVEVALAHGFEPYACRLPWPLMQHLDEHGEWSVLTRLAEHAVAAAGLLGDAHAEALARNDAALGRFRLGDHDRGLAHLEYSRAVLHELDDKRNLARAERITALICETLGRLDEEAHHAQRALDLARAVGDPGGEARGHAALAWAQVLRGDYESALDHALDGLALHRRTGNPGGEGDVLDTIAFLHYRRGYWEPTLEYYHRAEAAFGAAGARYDQFQTIVRISTVHARMGDTEAAERRLREALAIAEELGLLPEDAVAEANAVMVRFAS